MFTIQLNRCRPQSRKALCHKAAHWKKNLSTSFKRSSTFMRDCSTLKSLSWMVLKVCKDQTIDHWTLVWQKLIVLQYKAALRVGYSLEIASAPYECASYGRQNASSGATVSVTCTNGVVHLRVSNQSLGRSSTVTLDCLPRLLHARTIYVDVRPRPFCN